MPKVLSILNGSFGTISASEAYSFSAALCRGWRKGVAALPLRQLAGKRLDGGGDFPITESVSWNELASLREEVGPSKTSIRASMI